MRQTVCMRETEEQIIRRVLNGEQKAYALLVDEYKDRVFSLVMGILRQRELAEEVAQDVFVKAFRSLAKFRMEAGFSTWIYRIAYNSAISEKRKKNYFSSAGEMIEKSISDDQAENVQTDEKESRQRQLQQAIQQLAPDENLLLTLYYFDEKSVEEISRSTGLSQSNVKVKLFRLRNKLKELMLKYGKNELAFF